MDLLCHEDDDFEHRLRMSMGPNKSHAAIAPMRNVGNLYHPLRRIEDGDTFVPPPLTPEMARERIREGIAMVRGCNKNCNQDRACECRALGEPGLEPVVGPMNFRDWLRWLFF